MGNGLLTSRRAAKKRSIKVIRGLHKKHRLTGGIEKNIRPARPGGGGWGQNGTGAAPRGVAYRVAMGSAPGGGGGGQFSKKFLMTAFQNRQGSIFKSIIKNLCFLLPLPTPGTASRTGPEGKSAVFAPTCPPRGRLKPGHCPPDQLMCKQTS